MDSNSQSQYSTGTSRAELGTRHIFVVASGFIDASPQCFFRNYPRFALRFILFQTLLEENNPRLNFSGLETCFNDVYALPSLLAVNLYLFPPSGQSHLFEISRMYCRDDFADNRNHI